ncbi:MAG: hypothetical protein Q9222_001696 [Ikaeria aurantiellina]
MKLLNDCWVVVLGFVNALTLSPIHEQQPSQQVLDSIGASPDSYTPGGGPRFHPPGHPQKPDDDVLQCDYTPMGPRQQYDINTDYETKWPAGVTRKVCHSSYAIG